MSKRNKILGLAAAVAVVSAGAATSFAKQEYEEKTGKYYTGAGDNILSDILMQNSDSDPVQVAGHSSHASHGSHGSHGSHSSHSSGY